MICGIYKITNIRNNKFYIGSSFNIDKRIKDHFHLLKNNKHHSKHLQRAYNKHGKDNFKFEIIEECRIEELFEKEQYYLDNLLYAQDFISDINNKFVELGYNINPIANSPRGVTLSDETKLNISIAHKGKIKTKEHLMNYRIGKSKRVSQYDLEGNLVREWLGASFAAEELKLKPQSILRVCNGYRNKYHGFIWKYTQKE